MMSVVALVSYPIASIDVLKVEEEQVLCQCCEGQETARL